MTSPGGRIYIPGAYQLTLNMLDSGQEAAIVLGAKGSPGQFLVTDDAEAWRDAAWLNFRGLMNSGVQCTGATVRNVGAASGTVLEVAAPAQPLGGNAGAGAIAAASTLIKWSTNTGGRSGKGRTYLPGMPTSGISGTRSYSAGHVTSVNAAAASYLANAFWSGGFKPAVLSFTKGQAYEIVAGACGPLVGIQRRRMR